MINRTSVREALATRSDEQLWRIVTGLEGGYSVLALEIAQELLEHRGVDVPPTAHALRRDLEEAQRAHEERNARARKWEEDLRLRRLGYAAIVLGIGAFILPAFGYQFTLLTPFGGNVPAVAIALLLGGFALLYTSQSAPAPVRDASQQEHAVGEETDVAPPASSAAENEDVSPGEKLASGVMRPIATIVGVLVAGYALLILLGLVIRWRYGS